jgi:hypothetical protein
MQFLSVLLLLLLLLFIETFIMPLSHYPQRLENHTFAT